MSDSIRVQLWGFVNAFLVREEDGFTLVDTTMARGAGKILRSARDGGLPIARIALTHGHGDHLGGLDALVRELPDAEVIVSARDARLMEKDLSLDPGEPQTPIRGDLRGCATRPTRTVVEGDRIGSLEVVASPGHTPGHVAFLDSRDRSLIAGDVFTAYGRVAVSNHFYLRFPLAAMATFDKSQDAESARALRALDPKLLAVGHGPATPNPAAAMDRAIREAGA